MPIAALPEDTIRTIGSTQVLTDSTSVVKELVDNSLDARASSVFVEISANALDIIQVKDNGYGVAPVDRALVCKRYCTSKISLFDDIASIGGDSLGFRGEALASAAEMSGSLIVTTRIEGEPTATSLKIGRQGQIVSEERASHPVGTTVRVVDYLKNLPVRRQTALKSSSKALSTITKTLQAYALARPAIRFSLKVLKAKNEKSNWTYAPSKKDTSVLDAATKVVGKRVAEQCQWKVWSSQGRSDLDASQSGSDLKETFTIKCLLAIPGCDVSSISKAGQYLSIDSRPVSCARGTLKQIISLYKAYLRHACGLKDGEKIVDPFLCMNIFCPEKSYDANVEPAKDDVLFSDINSLLETVEAFFGNVYGELPPASKAPLSAKTVTQRPQDFDVLLARKPEPAPTLLPRIGTPSTVHQNKGNDPEHAVSAVSTASGIENAGRTSPILSTSPTRSSADRPVFDTSELASTANAGDPSRTNAWKSNMYAAGDDDDTGLFVSPDHHNTRPDSPDPDEEDSLRDVRVSNPWSLAKINALVRPHQRQQILGQQLLTPARQNDFERASRASSITMTGGNDSATQELFTPQQSQRDSSKNDRNSSSPERFPYPLAARGSRSGEHALKAQRAADRERYGSGALDTWIQKSIDGYNTAPSSTPAEGEDLIIDPSTGNTRHRDFVSACLLPTGTPLSEIPSAPTRPRRQSPKKQASSGINKPFTSPLTDDRVWFGTGQQMKSQSPPKGRSSSTQSTLTSQGALQFSSSASTSSSPERLVHPDLAITLDYENRKVLAAQQHRANLLLHQRQQLGLSENDIERRFPSNSPHQNRYNKAIAALHSDDDPSANPATSPRQRSAFEPSDPRQYWLRLQEREQLLGNTSPSRPSTAKRRKTAMLPLETTKEEWSVRDLVLPLKAIDLTALAPRIKPVGMCDEYLRSGKPSYGLTSVAKIDEVRAWEERIQGLLQGQYRSEDSPGGAVQLRVELWPVMQKHWVASSSSSSLEAG